MPMPNKVEINALLAGFVLGAATMATPALGIVLALCALCALVWRNSKN